MLRRVLGLFPRGESDSCAAVVMLWHECAMATQEHPIMQKQLKDDPAVRAAFPHCTTQL